ncbi:MAG: hypothetical protein EOP50_00525 [Sphingobacteriales bacterium]|nr:MAG: hypothetical protein EOP50_00525 [Sphingobacteriales bacterium]
MSIRKPKAPKYPKKPKQSASNEVKQNWLKRCDEKAAAYKKAVKEYESAIAEKKKLDEKIRNYKPGQSSARSTTRRRKATTTAKRRKPAARKSAPKRRARR